jgi:putative FmdB family regulatory protein
MPTYDYVCLACGHEFEHFQSMSDRRLGKCPKCGKPRLVRKVGAGAGVIFKGSGFYQTDYKAKPKPDAAKATSGDGAAKTESAPKETPAAPAASPAAKSSATASTPGKGSGGKKSGAARGKKDGA